MRLTRTILFALVVAGASATTAYASKEADSLRTITVNGATLHYLDVGQGEPVVLVHGMGGDYRSWRGQIAALSKKYRVISYSRRWHYPNSEGGDTDYSLARHVLDLLALMDQLDLTPAHLVGHDYGAQIVAAVARDHPEDVRSVVLCEPSLLGLLNGTPSGSKHQSEQNETVLRARMSMRDGFPEIAERAMIDWAFGWQGYESLPSHDRELLEDNEDALRRQIVAKKPDGLFAAADAKRIAAPVLFVEGERSPEMRHEVGEAFLSARPETERLKIRSSHGVPSASPGPFNKAVLKFLEAHTTTARPGSGVEVRETPPPRAIDARRPPRKGGRSASARPSPRPAARSGSSRTTGSRSSVEREPGRERLVLGERAAVDARAGRS